MQISLQWKENSYRHSTSSKTILIEKKHDSNKRTVNWNNGNDRIDIFLKVISPMWSDLKDSCSQSADMKFGAKIKEMG